MAILVAPSGAPLNLQDELERLRGVVADMEALARGVHPGHAVLADAPLIDGWALGSRTTHCLTGMVEGHPVLGSGRLAKTSDLWILALSHGYRPAPSAPAVSAAASISHWRASSTLGWIQATWGWPSVSSSARPRSPV